MKTTPSLAPEEDESVPKAEAEEREASEVEEEAEIVQQVKDHNTNHSSKASDDVLPNALNKEVEHEDEKAPEVIPVEGVCPSQDVFVSKIVEKINNSVSEEVSGQAETESINTDLNASQDNSQAEKVEDSALSNAVDDILGALDDILAKEKTGNTASEIKTINITELSSKPVATEKVNEEALQAETERLPSATKIPEIVITEPVIESCEKNEVILEQEAPINDNVNTGENSVNIELNESVEINESESVAEHEIQEGPSSVPTQHSGKRHSLVMVEKFSEKLSTSVIDAVLHRPDDDDDDYPGINDSENNLWKFSEILADSIVKTVLDYSKHSGENSNFSMHVECLEYDDTNQEDTDPENDVPTEDDTCSIEEMEDEPPFAGLNDYAKRLSDRF